MTDINSESPVTGIQKPLGIFTKVFILLIPLFIIAIFVAFFTNVFITIAISLLLALVLNPVVAFIESKGLNRTLSILIIYAVLAVAIYLVFVLVIPHVANQSENLRKSFKEFELSDKLKNTERWLEKNVPYLKRGDIGIQLAQDMRGTFSRVQDVISDIVSTAFFIFLIPFLTFFILRDRQGIKNGLISLVPNKYFEMTVNIVDKIESQLSRYVRGWLLDALFVGLLSAVGLSLLGIDDAFFIGLLATAGHLIPYAGPIVGGIPAILISIIQFGDFHMVLPIVIMFALIYVLDNTIAQPFIFSKSADMNPVSIIILILIGNEILGPFGALMAIPIATILRVSARETINGFRNYKLGYY